MVSNSLFEREALPQLQALRSFAMQLCRDYHWTNDLVQDTMLKAYTYFHTYKEGTNCRAWLFQICKNSYINNYRRKQYEPVAVDFREEASSQWSAADSNCQREVHLLPTDDSSLQMHSDLLGDEITISLNALPKDYQTAVLLCDIEGYTYEEIASFMRVPIGTIRSRIHRGRKILARMITINKTNTKTSLIEGGPNNEQVK